ncbi:MAG: ferritin-like domain-containing protein [Gammaproteobacteria bacterium]|nr:ferritin-like domain-containing protein [Gammaproteobacteria bacterium]
MSALNIEAKDIPTPPLEGLLHEQALAAYENSFRARAGIWAELLQESSARLASGRPSLHWLDTGTSGWGERRAKPSSRGLTYTDVNRLKQSGRMPAIATWKNFAPRGSIREPYRERMPICESYTVLNRDDVWAENVETLYEEAKARQWNATRDIPWGELEPLPEDLEKATCQLCTFLTEVEFVAGDFPAKWMYRIPQDFLEVKSFLSTQIMDEARHQEVFRKRALAGGGLLHSAPGFEWALAAILDAPTHTMGTFLLNLLGEGLILSVFRSGEMIAKTHVDKEIFRRCLQDEARHVSYGVMQFKNYLDNHPDRDAALEEMHRFADVGELVVLSAFVEAGFIEPVAILLGGGLNKIDQGMDGLAHMWTMFVEEYLQRCARAGFDRRARCKIPARAVWAA